jgi:GNAT superfamily N-acetyltransferase
MIPQEPLLTSKEIEIRTLGETDSEQRRAFYERMYPRRAELLQRSWRWWYRLDPASGLEPLAAIARGQMIAQFGTMPLVFRLGRRLEQGVWGLDFAVVPEARRCRLGARLLLTALARYRNLMGHGNERSFGLAQRIGWQTKHGVLRCALPINPGCLAAAGKLPRALAALLGAAGRAALRPLFAGAPALDPAPLPGDGELLASLLKRPACTLQLVRDADWMRWRLLECPFRQHYRLFCHAGAVAVARTLVQDGVKRLHLLAFGGDCRAPDGPALLRGVARWAADNDLHVLWTITDDPVFLGQARFLLPLRRPVLIASRSLDREVQAGLAAGCNPLWPIDTDFDLLQCSDPGTGECW